MDLAGAEVIELGVRLQSAPGCGDPVLCQGHRVPPRTGSRSAEGPFEAPTHYEGKRAARRSDALTREADGIPAGIRTPSSAQAADAAALDPRLSGIVCRVPPAGYLSRIVARIRKLPCGFTVPCRTPPSTSPMTSAPPGYLLALALLVDYVLVNLLVDLSYTFLDPRIRY